MTVFGPNEDAKKYPVCGGAVSLMVKAVDEPVMGGTYAKLELIWTCTRCEWAWVPQWFLLRDAAASGSLDITGILRVATAGKDGAS